MSIFGAPAAGVYVWASEVAPNIWITLGQASMDERVVRSRQPDDVYRPLRLLKLNDGEIIEQLDRTDG